MGTPIRNKPTWPQYFLRVAQVIASRSECLDKQVGCVITDHQNRIIGTGYNGFPAGGLNLCTSVCAKDMGESCEMVHAELNALLYSDVSRAHAMYVTLPPCSNCLRHIENTPISTLYLPLSYKNSPKTEILEKSTLNIEYVVPFFGFTFPDISETAVPVLKPRMYFSEAFDLIHEYHTRLGYPKESESDKELYQQFRDLIVALNQEVAELCDSFPWKPWRPLASQTRDTENAIMEMVDIFFFMGSILELFEISPMQLEEMLHSKLAENYNRIQRGYNKSKEDM